MENVSTNSLRVWDFFWVVQQMCSAGLGCLPANSSRKGIKALVLVSTMKMFPIHSSNANQQVGSLGNAGIDINSVVQSFQNELSVGSYPNNQGVSEAFLFILYSLISRVIIIIINIIVSTLPTEHCMPTQQCNLQLASNIVH